LKRTAELKRTPFKPKAPAAEPKRRTRKCAIKTCRTPFVPRSMTHKTCGEECALALVEQEKATRIRKEKQAGLAALKTKRDWLREVQTVFNQFIRLRDMLAGHACISSGRKLDWSGNAVDAGHYRSVGSAPHLRFNELNCHAQSKHDNQYKSGNAVDYRLGLIARIGLEAVEMLEADQTPRNYTIEDLKAMKAHYAAKVSQLKKEAACATTSTP
jgi:hypothetical protein